MTFKKGDVNWKKGTKKIQELDEIRTCKVCKEQKIVTEFVTGKAGLYRYLCKECRQASRRTGKISETRFKPGGHPGKEFQKGHEPWYKIKGVAHPMKGTSQGKTKGSVKTREWNISVKERDGWKCIKCGSNERLSAHHIIPWKQDETKRFDVDNGISLCNSCHAKEEGFKEGHKTWNKGKSGLMPEPWNKGKLMSNEFRKKISVAKKGKPSGREGQKHSEATKEKMRLVKLGKPSNRVKAQRGIIKMKAD